MYVTLFTTKTGAFMEVSYRHKPRERGAFGATNAQYLNKESKLIVPKLVQNNSEPLS